MKCDDCKHLTNKLPDGKNSIKPFCKKHNFAHLINGRTFTYDADSLIEIKIPDDCPDYEKILRQDLK